MAVHVCYLGPADVHWPPSHEHHDERSGDGATDGLDEIQLLSRQCELGAVMTLTARGGGRRGGANIGLCGAAV